MALTEAEDNSKIYLRFSIFTPTYELHNKQRGVFDRLVLDYLVDEIRYGHYISKDLNDSYLVYTLIKEIDSNYTEEVGVSMRDNLYNLMSVIKKVTSSEYLSNIFTDEKEQCFIRENYDGNVYDFFDKCILKYVIPWHIDNWCCDDGHERIMGRNIIM